MGKLIELADRAERATADEQRAILEEAFVAIHGPKPPRVHGGSAEMTAWLSLHNPFFGMLEAKAYESAAIQLVPEGCRLASFGQHREGWWEAIIVPGDEGYAKGKASEGALAICASSLRARDGGEGL